jgi:predicted dehydrogenase
VNSQRLRVAFLGAGQAAERWAAALTGKASVSRRRDAPRGEIDALVVAPGAGDAFPPVREALAAGVPVLYAAPFLFSPWQAAVLEALSRRQDCLLRIAEPFQYQGGYRFLGRLTRGSEPLWKLRYLRTTRLAQPQGGQRIDELAVEDLAMCQALLDAQPRSVMATAAQRDELGDVCALFLTVHYPRGPVVQCTISLAEASSARQLVAVTPSRALVLEGLDQGAPVRIMANSACNAAATRVIPVPNCDALAEEARRFLEAVAKRDRSQGNGARWVRVAALWWAARQSMSFGGAVDVPAPAVALAHAEPPPLRVIEGGGQVTRTVKRPELTLIAS